jgi:hypothetical protein
MSAVDTPAWRERCSCELLGLPRRRRALAALIGSAEADRIWTERRSTITGT